MLTAFAARRLGMQDRLVLAGVQMPPAPLWLVIVEFALRSAFRTGPVDHLLVPQVNVNLASLQLQLHRIYKPGSLNSENAPIEFVILHRRHCRMALTGGIDPL